MPIKEEKVDAILAVHFIAGDVWTLIHHQQDGALQFIKVTEQQNI